MIEIEKGIKISDVLNNGRGVGAKSKYPFKDMKIGDSFFVECDKPKTKKLSSILGCAGRCKPMKFTVRQVENGIRTWRIK